MAATDSGGGCFAAPRGGEKPAMSGYPHDPEEVDEGGRNPTQRHLDDEGPDDERPVAPEADEGETDRADEAPVS